MASRNERKRKAKAFRQRIAEAEALQKKLLAIALEPKAPKLSVADEYPCLEDGRERFDAMDKSYLKRTTPRFGRVETRAGKAKFKATEPPIVSTVEGRSFVNDLGHEVMGERMKRPIGKRKR